jgi:hypothetical protein
LVGTTRATEGACGEDFRNPCPALAFVQMSPNREASMNGQEVNRLAALRRYDILDTPPDGAFDRLTSIAARLFNVPIAIVSLVDEDRIWFKSHHGLETQQIPRSPGLCASAIMSDGPYVLEDARSDPHALSNPLVAGDFGLRFYCGVPLTTPDGYGLGTLCVIDREPREVTPDELIILKDLAGIVIDEMELRRSTLHSIAELESAAETREMLLREVHHRVKNNLQMIASMVSLRGRSAAHIPQVASQFREIQIRIQNLSKLHELVYASEDGASIDLCSYLLRRRPSKHTNSTTASLHTVQGPASLSALIKVSHYRLLWQRCSVISAIMRFRTTDGVMLFWAPPATSAV